MKAKCRMFGCTGIQWAEERVAHLLPHPYGAIASRFNKEHTRGLPEKMGFGTPFLCLD